MICCAHALNSYNIHKNNNRASAAFKHIIIIELIIT